MRVYSDNAYAAMLLTMALSPGKEEYARPYSVQEFRQLEETVRASELKSMGRLLSLDISGLMIYLGLSQEESYRAYTLLNRTVQLTHTLDRFAGEGIEAVTIYDGEYPQRVRSKLGAFAPPFYYRCGSAQLLSRPTIAVIGISGVRTTPEVRQAIEALSRYAAAHGVNMVTGGELGVSRVTAGLTGQCGGTLVDVLGGDMLSHIHLDGIAELIAQGRATVLSLEHPEAMFTVSHAIARSKLLFALSDAAFVFSTDGRRGEADALQNRVCDWIYAWEGGVGNDALIAKGASPLKALSEQKLEELGRHWASSRSEQLSLFDLL